MFVRPPLRAFIEKFNRRLKTLCADACLLRRKLPFLMPACLSSLVDDACLLSALPVQHLLVLILSDAWNGHGAARRSANSMKPRLFVGQPTVSSRLTKITTTKAGSCCFAYRSASRKLFQEPDNQSFAVTTWYSTITRRLRRHHRGSLSIVLTVGSPPAQLEST